MKPQCSVTNSPLSDCSSSLVSTSYRLAVRSHEAVMTWSPPGNQSAAITTPVCPVNSQTGVRRLGVPSDTATSSSNSSFSHRSMSYSEECPFFNTQTRIWWGKGKVVPVLKHHVVRAYGGCGSKDPRFGVTCKTRLRFHMMPQAVIKMKPLYFLKHCRKNVQWTLKISVWLTMWAHIFATKDNLARNIIR
jgi:hypothetical protein